MQTILHLISEQDWTAAQAAGEWRPESLESEGFIHGSKDQDQLFRVAQRLYAGRADLLALEVDTAALGDALVVEPSRSGELYPHIYGPLPVSAVVSIHKLELDDRGEFSLAVL